jgi:hypothetical protein
MQSRRGKIPMNPGETSGIDPADTGNELRMDCKNFFIYKGGVFCYHNSVRRSFVLTFQ